MNVFGHPIPPCRGSLSFLIDTVVTLGFAVPLTILLTFYVIDATLVNYRFIKCLADFPTHWPPGAYAQCRGRRLPDADLAEYLDVRLIAERTRVVGTLVYYPFIVLFLMVISRVSFFDNWDWPVGLIALLAVSAVVAVGCSLALRRAAERARRQTLESLRQRWLQYCTGYEGQRVKAEGIHNVMEEVRNERAGAFALLSQYPLLAAILLPSSGVGIWVLLDYLAKTYR
jgi:hypothetical protein